MRVAVGMAIRTLTFGTLVPIESISLFTGNVNRICKIFTVLTKKFLRTGDAPLLSAAAVTQYPLKNSRTGSPSETDRVALFCSRMEVNKNLVSQLLVPLVGAAIGRPPVSGIERSNETVPFRYVSGGQWPPLHANGAAFLIKSTAKFLFIFLHPPADSQFLGWRGCRGANLVTLDSQQHCVVLER